MGGGTWRSAGRWFGGDLVVWSGIAEVAKKRSLQPPETGPSGMAVGQGGGKTRQGEHQSPWLMKRKLELGYEIRLSKACRGKGVLPDDASLE